MLHRIKASNKHQWASLDLTHSSRPSSFNLYIFHLAVLDQSKATTTTLLNETSEEESEKVSYIIITIISKFIINYTLQ